MPFEIPASWEWAELDDYVKVVTDGDHQPPPQVPKGVPFLVISDVNTGKINFDKARFVSEFYYYELDEYRKAQYNDILFTVTGSYGIPVLVDTNRVFCFQRHIGLIKTIDDPSWLYYVLQSLYVKEICDKVATGTAQKTVSLGNLREMFIPVPPSNEQKRIVAEIEKWFSLIDEIEQNKVDLLKAIKAAKSKILSLAISGKLVPQDPNDEPAIELLKRINPHFVPCDTSHYENLPEAWCVAHMGEVYNHTTGKALKKADSAGELRQYITTSNVYWNSFDFTEVRSMYFTEKELDKCTVHKGDLLVCNGGDVGRAAIWDYDYDICYQNHISRLRPISVDIVFNPFYSYLFRYLKDKGQLNGKGVAITSLSATDIQSLAIPVPPLAEQKRIVKRIETIFAQLDTITAEL